VKHSLWEELPQEKGSYMVAAAPDVTAELHYDSHKDNETARRIEVEEDMVDSNVADIDDEVDGERDCEAGDCSDLRVPNVDMVQLEDHSERLKQHAPRLLRRDTFL